MHSLGEDELETSELLSSTLDKGGETRELKIREQTDAAKGNKDTQGKKRPSPA
jgi:hypothetical protein